VLEAVFDASGEVLQACDEQEQFTSLRGQLYLGPQLLLDARRALLRTANPKRKLILVDEAVGVSVNQTGNGLFNLGDLRFYRIQIRINLGRRQAPAVFVLESPRAFKQSAHLSPDRRLEQITPDLRICAYPPTAESIAVSPGAAVVDIIDELPASTSLPQPLGVICISARTATGEALEKTTRMSATFASPRSILAKLFLSRFE
jgi:hypothetical protein